MLGAHGQSKTATPEVQAMVDGLLGDVNTKLGTSYAKLTATHFTSQVVAGTNFKVKATSGSDVVHLKVFRPLPHTGQPHQLTEAVGGKTTACPL